MSALPPKADICSALAHVRSVPKADITVAYSNYRAGTNQQRRWHRGAERLGGPELDSKLEFFRRFSWSTEDRVFLFIRQGKQAEAVIGTLNFFRPISST